VVTIASHLVVLGNEVVSHVRLIDLCVVALTPYGWLARNMDDSLPGFGLLSRNIF
jgi:hypothetical protein